MTRRAYWIRRSLLLLLALAAVAYVIRAVPIRDRCRDPSAASVDAPRIVVSRDDDGCTLHRVEGDLRLARAACAGLDCEPGLGSTLARANVPLLGLLALVNFTGTLVWAWRWRALVQLAKLQMSLRSVWRVILESMGVALVSPAGIGGDAVRIGTMVGRGAPVATVVASVLLDRVLGLATIAALAALLSAAWGGADPGAMTVTLGAVPVGVAAVLFVLRRPTLARARLFERGFLSKTARPVLDYMAGDGAPRAIGLNLVGCFANGAIQLVVIRALLFALGATPTDERWVFLGYVLSIVVIALPGAPGGWGTGDAAFVYFLGRAGITPATGLAVSLLLRLFGYIPGPIGAVLLAFRGKEPDAAVKTTRASS
jgi:uncharacterized membrane protein YbhN (UPF0104 family)